MIGIDIVDLHDPKLRTRKDSDLRFIESSEDQFPKNIEDENLRFWIIWSAKEAIFKARRVLEVFDPKSISVQFNQLSFKCENLIGDVQYDSEKVVVFCSEEGTVTQHDTDNSDDGDVSSEVRAFAAKQLPSHSVIIADENGLPLIKNENGVYPISFSHHGRFIAFCFPRF